MGTVTQDRPWRLPGLKRSDSIQMIQEGQARQPARRHSIQVFAQRAANRDSLPAIQDPAQGCSTGSPTNLSFSSDFEKLKLARTKQTACNCLEAGWQVLRRTIMSNRKSIAHMFSKILSNGGATLALVLALLGSNAMAQQPAAGSRYDI